MAERTLAENVAQAISDFKEIKVAVNTQVQESIPEGTPTSEYGVLIDAAISTSRSLGQDEGFADGYQSGKEEGIEQGKQAEYDAFWDKLQNYGEPMQLWGGFAYEMWNDETFKPKYPIRCKTTSGYLFYSTSITDVYVDVDVSLLSGINAFYNAPKVRRVKKFILSNNGDQTFSTSFQGATGLEEITIEGVIGRDINFSSCPLNRDSLTSVRNALKDFSGTSTTRTIQFSETSKALLTEAEIAEITQKGWTIA